jgi:hypothetical protein
VSPLRRTAALLALVTAAPACAAAHAAGRRPRPVAAARAHGGRHVVAVRAGAVLVDGRPVHAEAALLTGPTWRADGDAVAWTERAGAETHLVVLPRLSDDTEPLVWPLPGTLAAERVHWAGATRVVVGPAVLEPRAVVSWSE